MIIIFKF